MTDVIRLPAQSFSQLAAGHGDAETIARLRRGQLSRRLFLLRALLDADPSPATEASLELLVRAQAHRPEAVDEVLLAPHVGSWLTVTLRRLRAGPATVPPRSRRSGTTVGTVAASRDVGRLGEIAAAAAARAGLDFTIELSSTDGQVMLPTYGRAESGTGSVTVTAEDGRLRIGPVLVPTDPSADAPGWSGLRAIAAQAAGRTLRLIIDDLDPWRDVHQLRAAGRLSDPELAGWQAALDEAWPVLVRSHPSYAEGIAAGLTTIVPLVAPEESYGVNATAMESFGAVSLTPPTDPLALAAALVHEWQHAKLGALLDLIPLHHADSEPRHYAPWRDDPRPLGGLLHGVYAFFGVTDFWRVQRHVQRDAAARFADFEFARWRSMVWQTTELLHGVPNLTEEGQRFLATLTERQRRWLAEPVSPAAASLARQVTAEHRLGWRLRNRMPDPHRVRRLADDWLAGAAASPGPISAVLTHDVGWTSTHNVRFDLAGLQMADPEGFDQLCTDPAQVTTQVPQASAGDIAQILGDHATARAAYLRQILDQPDEPRSWVGLAILTELSGDGADGETAALHQMPELVAALHREIRRRGADAPDPLRLTRWLRPLVAEAPEAVSPAAGAPLAARA
ncbi:HEXXH motif domain-containing protein [Micromonospora sp. DT68]|uniref:HEXXH motif domain-containing protein n=1 Tax=Micromonospora sp. DT68 TaxID=3416522 RepID=UPI003CE6F788